MKNQMSTSVGKCTPIIKDHPAGHSNDGVTPAPKVSGILSHHCKAERGGSKTAGVPAYVLTVKNP
jgi:hypothetical protein